MRSDLLAQPLLLAELTVGFGTPAALVIVIVASVWLGWLAQRAVEKGSFVQGFFLGNRTLGSWALALTATVQSGGTFMGFPALVYSHGWSVALWIAGYMVVPLTAFGLFGKRLAQLSRRTAAVTVPDLLRARFASPAVGLAASLLIIFFLSFMMVAQFKAGAIVMKLALPGTGVLSLNEDAAATLDWGYYLGLCVFALTVVGYTMLGGFLASVWTDLLQSLLMAIGVVVLLVLVIPLAGGMEQATRTAVAQTGPAFAEPSGFDSTHSDRQFLPIGLAFSMFFVWVFGGVASPASLVRTMATQDTPTLRRSIVLLSSYNLAIYLPLVVICVAARAVLPNLDQPDEVIPRITLLVTQDVPGGSWLAGLILAAPFGAVMATVSTYLVVIASGLVHDVYQQFIHPTATELQIRRLTFWVMLVVGLIAVVANLQPPRYLQAIVVFCASSGAATFFVPMLMACYWRRATAAGVLASMFAGAATMLLLLIAGSFAPDPKIGQETTFRAFFLLQLEPVVWGLLVSLVAGVGVSFCTTPPPEETLNRLWQ